MLCYSQEFVCHWLCQCSYRLANHIPALAKPVAHDAKLTSSPRRTGEGLGMKYKSFEALTDGHKAAANPG
jgi:hypothetical protein